jgi:predicted PurR-regulated permease PerM
MAPQEGATTTPDQKARVRLAPIRQFALLIATSIGLYLCYLVTLPFLPALAWALTVAVLAAPLHRRLRRTFKDSSFAATICVVALALIVFLPLIFLGQYLLAVLSGGISGLQEQIGKTDWQALVSSYPSLAWIANATDTKDFATVFGNVGTWLTNVAGSLVRESLTNVITLLLTFYFLFYFLRDRDEILRQATMLSPLTDSETDHVFGRVADTINGVVFGTVVTAAVQGTLGGLIFWLLGLPNPLFWGVVMGLLAIVPVLGAFVIWIPAAIYLALTGEWTKAVILTAYGTVVIGGIDNILHPVLAGGRVQLHTVPTFIAIVGGLGLFGASGLILGPLVMTITITLLQIWRARAHRTTVQARVEKE